MLKVFALIAVSLFGFTGHAAANDRPEPLLIFAASSLTDVLQKQGVNWSKKTNHPLPRFSFAASAVMARQIKAGAPADIFISANPEWVAVLEDAHLTEGLSHSVAHNQLVFAAPKTTNLQPFNMLSKQKFLEIFTNQRIAIADPATAPAGTYAKHYLEQLGVWETISPHLAFGSNVRQTLLLIERGGLYGFVYGSDANQSVHVKVLFTVPENLSGTILYKAVKINNGTPEAADFISYLTSSSAHTVWQQAGFGLAVPN